jgi:hypothetical protein
LDRCVACAHQTGCAETVKEWNELWFVVDACAGESAVKTRALCW